MWMREIGRIIRVDFISGMLPAVDWSVPLYP